MSGRGTLTKVLKKEDFSSEFVVECDASGHGFGAVLHQGSGAIAFFSRPITAHHAKLPAYEREFIRLVQAVRHWQLYLWGQHFLVTTNHYSLKFLLDQRLSIVPQHQWMRQPLGFDFNVEYKPGSSNLAADALSRRDTEHTRGHGVISNPLCHLRRSAQ